jgi:hypothetical protein
MKVFITIKITILTLFLAFNVYSQSNPDFDPFGKKLFFQPQYTDLSDDIISKWDTIRATPLPYSRSASAYVTIGGVSYIYQFGGGLDTQYTMVARYDVSSGTWSTNFSRIPSNMSGATAITIGTNIYLFGGESVAGLGKTFKYDPVNDTWVTLANMPTPVTDAAVFNYDNNLIYVIGGGNGLFATGIAYKNSVQIYHINSDTYTTATNYPINAGMMGIGNWLDTVICVGGYNGTGAIDSVYRGVINKNNPSVITWSGTAYPKYPVGPITRVSSVNIRKGNAVGVLFAGGSLNGVNSVSSAFYWDFALLKWRQLPDMIVPKANSKAVFSGDSIAYLIAGFSTLPTGRNDKITFSKISGISNELHPFSLLYPADNSTYTSVIGSNNPVLFTWDSSGTNAIYKWSFVKDSDTSKRIDTTITFGYHLFKLTENDLDKILSTTTPKWTGLAQGESVQGTWFVYAYKGPGAPGGNDAIRSNEIFHLTFKRFKPTLSAFNLLTPVDGTKLMTANYYNYPVQFSWTSAGYGVSYKLYYIDTVRNRTLILPSGNSGADSLLSIYNYKLDSIFAASPWSILQGDSTVGKWKVYAYNGTDSVVSAQSNNITFKRLANQLNRFTLVSPVSDTTAISISNFTSIDFKWRVSSPGATYKWQLSSNSGFTGSLLRNLQSNNNGFDTTFTLQTASLSNLLTAGGRLTTYWRVFAYKGTDSLKSDTTFMIVFKSSTEEQLLQKFTSLNFPPPNWNIEFSGTNRWSREPFNAYFDTTVNPRGCTKFDFFGSLKGTKQSMVTNLFPEVQYEAGDGSDTLMFDYAHAYSGDANIDTLFIYYSTQDTGLIKDSLYTLVSSPNFNDINSLSTIVYQGGPYTPGDVSQWKTKKLGLPVSTKRVRFIAVSGWGNNLYIDNIKLRNKAPKKDVPNDLSRDTIHYVNFKWAKTTIPSYDSIQITLATDTFFTSQNMRAYRTPFDISSMYTDYPFESYTWYRWRIKVMNDAGESPWSKTPYQFFIDLATPLYQLFDTVFPPPHWTVENLDTTNLTTYWSKAQVGGNPNANYAAKFDYFSSPYSKERSLITNVFTQTGHLGPADTLYFDIAHAYANNINKDTLYIDVSTNYGVSFTKLATFSSSPYKDSTYTPLHSMSTTILNGTSFTPTQPSDWKTIKIIMNASVTKLRFRCLSGHGNNVYITNVRFNNTQIENPVLGLLPKEYQLNNNYPNPFNPTTTISYSIPKVSLTKLVIYDVLGREITRLVNEVKNPGTYSVTFNASNFASGVYFYRLESGDFVDVKKMLLIK